MPRRRTPACPGQYCLVSSRPETDYAAFAALLKCQSMRVALMRVGLPGAGFLRGCLSFYRRDSPK
ncbi:MAG: hypothetical protein ACLT8E_01805 [Akkermansia sp.]